MNRWNTLKRVHKVSIYKLSMITIPWFLHFSSPHIFLSLSPTSFLSFPSPPSSECLLLPYLLLCFTSTLSWLCLCFKPQIFLQYFSPHPPSLTLYYCSLILTSLSPLQNQIVGGNRSWLRSIRLWTGLYWYNQLQFVTLVFFYAEKYSQYKWSCLNANFIFFPRSLSHLVKTSSGLVKDLFEWFKLANMS